MNDIQPTVPAGIHAPSLVSQTSTSVFIIWSVPDRPNGNILLYILDRRLAVSIRCSSVIVCLIISILRGYNN